MSISASGTKCECTWNCLVAMRESEGVVWGRFDHKEPGIGAAEWSLMIGAAALFAVVVLYSYWRSRIHKTGFVNNSSSRLFAELARMHRLSRSQRQTLKKLAATRGAGSAAQLFVEPRYLATNDTPPMAKMSADEIDRLRRQLFE